LPYEHPSELDFLKKIPHKDKSAAACRVGVLTENHQFSGKSLYGSCRFIFLIGDGRSGCPYDYYRYRLRRLYEIYREAGGYLLLRDDLGDSRVTEGLLSWMGLRGSLSVPPVDLPTVEIGERKRLDSVYERYLFKFKSV
jgi:hypothetical protein